MLEQTFIHIPGIRLRQNRSSGGHTIGEMTRPLRH